MTKKPVLYMVIPCYNEEAVLPITAPMFLNKLQELAEKEKISEKSRVMFVDDGSKDGTWGIITRLNKEDSRYIGVKQSRNRGHQNALWCGLMEAKELADVTITIDCDGQDDINAMDEMVDEYLSGCEIVYGVRDNRDTDTWFKRTTATSFYKIMKKLGGDIVYNHADYRLASSRVLKELSNFREVNLFLRGMFPLVGFKSTSVYYNREERIAGKTHYPLKRMISLALNGITSFSIKPIRLITGAGLLVSAVSVAGIIWAIVSWVVGSAIAGWTSLICAICFLAGIQLVSLGVIGEYVGKLYMEVKNRPRYIVSERTYEGASDDGKE